MAERRRPGRPRVEQPKPGATASTWLEPDKHDRLIRLANKQEMSLSAALRLAVDKLLESRR